MYRAGDAGMKLTGIFVGAVRAQRGSGTLLVDRDAAVIPIDCRGRGVDDGNLPFTTRRLRLVKNIDRAGQVDLMATNPVAVRPWDGGDGSQVKAPIDSFECTVHRLRIGDIRLDEFGLARQIPKIPGREII